MFFGLHWSILLVTLALGIIGLWVAYSFLNKNGLFLFSIVAVLIGITIYDASMFSKPISILTVIMPIVFLALLVCYNKFGKDDAKKLFFIILISMAACFVCNFFQAAYMDSAIKSPTYLTWNFLGRYISPIVSFTVAGVLGLFLIEKIKIKKLKPFLKLAIFIAIAACIDATIYTILALTGEASFGDIILTILIKLVLVALISFGLGYFEKYLNREPKKLEEVTEEAKPAENKEVKPEEKATEEEVKTPEDID